MRERRSLASSRVAPSLVSNYLSCLYGLVHCARKQSKLITSRGQNDLVGGDLLVADPRGSEAQEPPRRTFH